jgi:hypothetical protein
MDTDPDPAIFVTDIQDAIKKLFFLSFSVYYFLKGQQESRFFSLFLLEPDTIQEAQKHTDPTGTDPDLY